MRSTLALLACIAAGPALAQDDSPLPKLGPNATPITEATDYLRQSPAPDFWAFSQFVKPQYTTSACSIAAVTAAVNGLNGLPAAAEDTVLSQPGLLELVGSADWTALSAEGGDGVRFDQLESFTRAAVDALGMAGDSVTAFHPDGVSEENLATTRAWLAANEASADDALLVYFNQGVVTGDWDGPHVSVIGAYDAAADTVLILEVDQDWYIPYWTSVPVLLEAMVKPTSAEHGPLEGETGGFVRIGPAS